MFLKKKLGLKKLLLAGKVAVAMGLFFGIEQLTELATHGFSLQKIIATDLFPQEKWDVPFLPQEQESILQNVLSQPFHLIGSGSECFAFESEDKTMVIKFFKLNYTRPVYFLKGLIREDHREHAGTLSNSFIKNKWLEPLQTMRSRICGIREFRLKRTFESSVLAYQALKEETGLFYLHLNPTSHLNKTLTLIDGNGIAHSIDLDSTPFFLQYRATPLEKHFTALIKDQKLLEARQSIDSLFEMIISRCQKGFHDRDLINRNLGFIGTQAIEIDAGSFIYDPYMQKRSAYKRELFYGTIELREWLRHHSPELLEYYETKLDEHIHQ